MFAEGEIPKKSEGDEVPVIDEEQEPREEGPCEIVDLVDVPEGEDSPVNLRESRRMARRSALHEVDEGNQSKGVRFLAPGAGSVREGGMSGSDEEVDTAEERRMAMERKRKGKKVATHQPKKSQRISSVREAVTPPRAPSKFPTPGNADAESESEEESEEEEVPNFERTKVWVTKKLLVSMAKFNDSRRAQTYKDRSAVRKLAKSRKSYDSRSLRHIESEEEFLGHIRDISFEWMLKHSEQEVPVDATREFFSTFRFKATTDPNADSISFCLFKIEHARSVREWSLQMRLFRNAEDEEGIWDYRMFGPPRNTPRFAP